ncbi:MAG: hypothetical protein J7L88_02215, partial [Thermoplasmata archaeon]|nr:hypothetical protein [Thermoplasmata archaeon]
MRELNNGQEEDEKEKKRKWLQRQRMLQDELVKLKFEMIEEGKKRDDIPVRSPYLESVSGRVSPPKEEINELQIGLKKMGGGGENVPKIPKPPDLAEHIAKILEHENKIKRKRYQMKREGEKVKREVAREGRRGEEAAGREEKTPEKVSKVGVGEPTKAKMEGKQPTHEP